MVEQGKASSGRQPGVGAAAGAGGGGSARPARVMLPPIVVNLNSSTTELKLLRVLQTLVKLSAKDGGERDQREALQLQRQLMLARALHLTFCAALAMCWGCQELVLKALSTTRSLR